MEDQFSKQFNKELIGLVIPIAIQNLISAAVVTADILMIGVINQNAMAALSLAGQITFVLTLVYFGLSAGTGIMVAQYWGKGDRDSQERTLTIASFYSVIVSLLFFLLALFTPASLMRILTNDPVLVEYGRIYLHPVAFSYLAMSLSQIYLAAIKSKENARLSALISSVSLVVNVVLDGACIFFLFPDNPQRAIAGVAAATASARFLELIWCLLHSRTEQGVSFRFRRRDEKEQQLRKDFLHYTLPILGNFIVWGVALAATTAIIGHVSGDMVAAHSLVSVIKNLAVVICTGIGAGGSVLIGKYLGAGNREFARRAGNRVSLYALSFGILAGLTVLFLKPFVMNVVYLNGTARGYLGGMLLISAVYCIGKALNSTIIGGIFPAGGDSRFGFWCDTIVMWGIILPLSSAAAFLWHFSPVWIFAVISLDEFIKLLPALLRYRRYKWLKNITREFAPA